MECETQCFVAAVQRAGRFDKDAGRGPACVPGELGWSQGPGALWDEGDWAGTPRSFPLPGREQSRLRAQRPQAVVCNSRDGLKTYSCYVSHGLIESRSLKSSSLSSTLFFPSLFLYELLSLVFFILLKKTKSVGTRPKSKVNRKKIFFNLSDIYIHAHTQSVTLT